MRRLTILLFAGVVVGCREARPTEVSCPSRTNYALHVRLQDAQTGALAPFSNVSITATEGQYRDSVHVNTVTDSLIDKGSTAFGLAFDRGGTYAITVTASGYATWTASGITTVAHLTCAYGSDTVTARLTRP